MFVVIACCGGGGDEDENTDNEHLRPFYFLFQTASLFRVFCFVFVLHLHIFFTNQYKRLVRLVCVCVCVCALFDSVLWYTVLLVFFCLFVGDFYSSYF